MGKEDIASQPDNPLPKLSQDEVAEGLTLRIKRLTEEEIEEISEIDRIIIEGLGGPKIKRRLNRIFFSAMEPTSVKSRDRAIKTAKWFIQEHQTVLENPNLTSEKQTYHQEK